MTGKPLLPKLDESSVSMKAMSSHEEWVEFFKRLINCAPVALLGVQDDKIFFANKRVESICGWKPSELLGKPIEELFYTPLKNLSSHSVHTQLNHQNGHTVPCLVSVSDMNFPTRKIKIIALFDGRQNQEKIKKYQSELESLVEEKTRELREAKETVEKQLLSLEKEEQEKQAIMDSVRDHVLLLDRNLRIRWANKAIRNYFKKNEEELRGRFCYEALYGKNTPCPQCPARKSIESRREHLADRTDSKGRTWLYRSYPVLDSSGEIMGAVETASDITTWKEYEETLRESEERYRSIIENLDDGYFENDLRGTITFANESMARILGRPMKEIIGLNYRTYTPEQEARRVKEAYGELYRTGVPIKVFDHEILRPNGEIRYVDISASLIKDRKGNPVGFRGTVKDVTERKKIEEESKKLVHQLYQSQKLKAIGTLAGGIAHDFNNLLMGIQGYTSLMLLDLDPSHPHYEKLKSIEAQVQSGADLTRQILGFARGGRYEVKKTNINELLRNTVKMFGRTKKELVIHETYAPDLWTVEVDRGQIEQVVINLLLNAWQAMPGGGSIYVTTENCTLKETHLTYFNVPPGRYVKFSITDTGIGMDEKTLERIFEPFFTTKEMGRGTGLGLATAYGIIKGHGGVIKVYSEQGVGTTFNIYLPASAGEVPEEKQREKKQICRGEGTILIVDDEEAIREVTRGILESLGYLVIEARSGKEAISIYKEQGKNIDLVILDMIMPGMSGGATFDVLKSMNPQVKVILASGYPENGMAKEILDRGVMGFLQKPFRIDDLSSKVQEVLKQNGN